MTSEQIAKKLGWTCQQNVWMSPDANRYYFGTCPNFAGSVDVVLKECASYGITAGIGPGWHINSGMRGLQAGYRAYMHWGAYTAWSSKHPAEALSACLIQFRNRLIRDEEKRLLGRKYVARKVFKVDISSRKSKKTS